ncbi:MAG TPA: hypothetical protein VFL70_00595 [Bacteroidia bacterium]|nr:hypothetical protein [Bacteroidia bacterium]
MRNIFFSAIVACLMIGSCNTSKNTGISETNTDDKETSHPSKTTGRVSHQFRATGCATIIIVKTKDTANPIILIPRDPLPHELDVNGLEISFNYHTLRIPQPPGCDKGIPANISDLKKK